MAARRNRSIWVLRAVLSVVAAVAVACSGSGYTYISSSSTRTYLKVPDDWKVFKKDEVLARAGGVLKFDETDRFLVAFDAHPKPSLSHSFVTGDYPFGQVRVRALGDEEADLYSFAMLRNEIVEVDELYQADQLEPLANVRQLTEKGLRGSRLEYSVTREQGTFVMSQVGFVDTATRNVWFLAVGCSASCYQRHKRAIHDVMDSWTVEGK